MTNSEKASVTAYNKYLYARCYIGVLQVSEGLDTCTSAITDLYRSRDSESSVHR